MNAQQKEDLSLIKEVSVNKFRDVVIAWHDEFSAVEISRLLSMDIEVVKRVIEVAKRINDENITKAN